MVGAVVVATGVRQDAGPQHPYILLASSYVRFHGRRRRCRDCRQTAVGMRNRMTRALDARTSEPSSENAGRLFVVTCSLGIAAGIVAIAGMLLAAAAFATASTFIVPLVASFEGFRDVGGTNAVTVTGSWAMAGGLTLTLAFLLSFFVLRRVAPSGSGVSRG